MSCPTSSSRAKLEDRSRSDATYSMPWSSTTTEASVSSPVQNRNTRFTLAGSFFRFVMSHPCTRPPELAK